VSVDVAVSHATILQYDPLFLRIAMQNTSDTSIIYDTPVSALHGTVVIEVKAPQERKFRPIDCRELPEGVTLKKSTRMLPANGVEYDYEIVFSHGREFVFDSPGEWELRVRLLNNGDLRGESEPVKVTVSSAAEQIQKHRLANARLLRSAIGITGVFAEVDSASLQDYTAGECKSELLTSLKWIIPAKKVVEADDDVGRLAAIVEFESSTKPLNDIERDISRLVLAVALRQSKLLQDSRDELKKVLYRDTHAIRQDYIISEYLREMK
jgi:hypothetical protein